MLAVNPAPWVELTTSRGLSDFELVNEDVIAPSYAQTVPSSSSKRTENFGVS